MPWLVGVSRRTNEDIKRRLSLELIYTLINSKSWPYKTKLWLYLKRDKALMALLFLTAGRISEVLSLTKEQFDFEADQNACIENQKVDPRLSTINKILQVLTEGKGKKCREIMTRNVIFAKPSDKVLMISEKMIEKAISQLPVQKQGKIVGTVMEESVIKNLHIKIAEETVEAIMDPPLPIVSEDVEVNTIRPLLEDHLGVLIVRRGNVVGIITRSDILKILSQFP